MDGNCIPPQPNGFYPVYIDPSINPTSTKASNHYDEIYSSSSCSGSPQYDTPQTAGEGAGYMQWGDGCGVGLATMAAVVPWARRRKIAVTAILSARSPWDLMEREFTQHEQITVHPVFDQDGSSSVERVESLLENIIKESRPDITFTCGSNRLMQVMQKMGRKHGIPGEIALEQQMACALGVCLSCVRPIQVGNETVHKRVCCEGPVFDVQQVRGTWVHG